MTSRNWFDDIDLQQDSDEELFQQVDHAHSRRLTHDKSVHDILVRGRGLSRKPKQPRALQGTRKVGIFRAPSQLLRKYGSDMDIQPFHAHVRLRHGIVNRKRVRAAAKPKCSEGSEEQSEHDGQESSGVDLPGPNHVWSMGAHDKLEPYGLQIYAAVDAYSRHVIWIYVGLSGRSGVSIVTQYLQALADVEILPELILSGGGAEMTMTADAHYILSSKLRPRADGEPLQIGECFRHDNSRTTHPVQSLWSQLSRLGLESWRIHFEELAETGQYRHDIVVDRIAFLAIYMPIIRKRVHELEHLWDIHRIRKQLNRPLAVAGIPSRLYSYPEQSGAIPRGTSISHDQVKAKIDELHNLGVDIDEYLPPATLAWCHQSLVSAGFAVPVSANAKNGERHGERMHSDAYRHLKKDVYRHLMTGQEPRLRETVRPSGPTYWRPDPATVAAFNAADRGLPLETAV